MSMWFDYLVIGSGEKLSGAILVTSLGENHHISENRNSYWIGDAYLGVYMTIYKDTKEGKKLAEMINEGKSLQQINAWLDTVVLKHLSIAKLKERIEAEKVRMFKEGEEKRGHDIGRLIGANKTIYISGPSYDSP